jgi:arylsulfatase A-like enzyme
MRHAIKWIAGFAGLVLAAAAAMARQPNVVFILVDDLGWKDTGCYGSSFYETPNVDRLAASGMRFTDAYSANPLCCPTRSSILTGQYPVRTGFTGASGHVRGEHPHQESTRSAPDARAAGPSSLNHLPLEYFTLGKAMKQAGYQTAYFGKWHMGYDPHIPENHGFDRVVGGREHPGPPGANPQRAFFPPWNVDTLQPNPAADVHIDDHLTDKALEFIANNKQRPFFIHFNFYNVHAPFQCKPELVAKWKLKTDPSNPQHCPTMAAMIEVMDDNVGRLLDALQQHGLEKDTIVIFTSDNGGNMYDTADGTTPTNNQPLRAGKGNNYEGGVRIPLIVRAPATTTPGSVNPSVISTVDHYPSLLEMTGQKPRPDDHKDGVSYLPALSGKPHDRGPTICDFSHFVPAPMNIPNTWIRSGDWKLLRFWFDGSGQQHRYELYHLKDDIGETHNLTDKHPEKVRTLAAQLDNYYQQTGALQPQRNENYNGRTIGVWVIDNATRGTATVVDGALSLSSLQAQFAATTRVTPSLINGGVLEFEGRSATGNHLSVQWTSSQQPAYKPTQIARADLTKDWARHRIKLPFTGNIKDLRFVLRDAGWQADLRNLKLLTTDGSVISEYRFYE